MKRRPPNSPALPCCKCGLPTNEPRRGLCKRCYLAAHRGREKDEGCACCGAADARVLVRKTLAGDTVTLCGNCATIAGRRRISLSDLILEVHPPGDRRGGDRRRGDRRAPVDRRAHQDLDALLEERRVGDRRGSLAA